MRRSIRRSLAPTMYWIVGRLLLLHCIALHCTDNCDGLDLCCREIHFCHRSPSQCYSQQCAVARCRKKCGQGLISEYQLRFARRQGTQDYELKNSAWSCLFMPDSRSQASLLPDRISKRLLYIGYISVMHLHSMGQVYYHRTLLLDCLHGLYVLHNE